MARDHVVEITVGGGERAVRLESWDEVALTLDMTRPGNAFTLTVWREGRGSAWARVRDGARLYDPCTVRVDGAVQLVGVIERLRDGADKAGAPFTLSGRDQLAGALVSDVNPRLSLRGATLEEVFRRALDPLGIDVIIGAHADDVRSMQARLRPGPARPTRRASRGHRVDRAKPKIGERVWAFLEQLARRHGYLIYPAPCGESVGLVIDRPAYDAPPAGLLWRRRTQRPDGTYEGNLLSGFLDLDATEVPTDVTVFGHATLSAREDARHEASVSNDRLALGGPAVATVFPARHRYLHDPRARTPQLARQRGRREIARAMVNFAVFEAETQGWSYDAGAAERLWTINTPAPIADAVSGARGNWLITRLDFQRGRGGGHTTKLRLVPPGSIDVIPDPEV